MKILHYCLFVVLVLVISCFTTNKGPLYAVTTKIWTDTNSLDFSQGKMDNVASYENGKVTLSPDKHKLKEIPASYVWCLANGRDGLIYAGTGGPGSIFKINRIWEITELFKTPELHVQSIAVDAKGNIYAGTLPHGRIYKITPDGNGEVFCGLPCPYIWDLIFDKNGNLYAATGNNGIIYKISEDGAYSVFFDSTSSNILDLVIDNDNNIYAAGEPEGLVYKITHNGIPSVIYDAEEEEINCLALDSNGILYAGTSSGKTPSIPRITPPAPPEIQHVAPIDELPNESYGFLFGDDLLRTFTSNNDKAGQKTPAMVEEEENDEIRETPVTAKRNYVYKIDKEGRVKKVLAVKKAFILSLNVDDNNDVYVGTGNKAMLYKIDSNENVSLLYDFYESQILDILTDKKGRKYISTGNSGNIYHMSNGFSKMGTYESSVHDTSYISSWGCVSWKAMVGPKTEVKLSTRTGNSSKPDISWSDWTRGNKSSGEKIKSPSARFIQYRATLATDDSTKTPTLDSVSIAYLPQNQSPSIRVIKVSSPGNSSNAKQDNGNNEDIESESNGNNFDVVIHVPKKKISWLADDDNYDRLRFDLEYKSVDENKWKELKRNINEDEKYLWNTNRIPDGYYHVKVIASDILDNPREFVLKEEKISDTFLVDNTRPAIFDLKRVNYADNTLTISGVARDEMSYIHKIQYSIDSGGWHNVFPVDKIFDSQEESFLLKIPYISSEEHTIVINALDAEGNAGSSKIVFTP